MAHQPPNQGRRRNGSAFSSLRLGKAALSLSAISVALAAGCANPGVPKPPSLHLPELPAQLAAERAGNSVTLSWVTSADSTDGGALPGPISARVCRDDAPASGIPGKPALCEPVARVPVVPGQSRVRIVLPASLLTGAPHPVAFRVELLNGRERSAGASEPVFALAGAAPPVPGPLRVSAVRNAVEIAWPAEPDAAVELHRLLIATSAGPYVAATPDAIRRSSRPAAHPASGPPLTQPDVTLRPEQAGDPGGLVDRTVHAGDTLTYSARRYVRAPTPGLAHSGARPAANAPVRRHGAGKAHAGSGVTSLVMYSDASSPVTFSFEDTVPPAAPGGLQAVPGGGFGEPISVDLSWVPSEDPDLAGYNVYRADEPRPGDAPYFTRLNARVVPGPGFRDRTATPGRHYLYRVTALDRRSSESEPGPALAVAAAAP